MLASETTRRTTSTGSTGAAAVEWLTGMAACRLVSGGRELLMSQTLPNHADALPRQTLADVCGRPAKASLDPQVRASADLSPQDGASDLRAVVAEAIRRVTSQKAAALTIGIDESRLSHKVKDASLRVSELEALGPAFCAELGRELTERYATLVSPKARAKQAIREVRRWLDELDQFLELVA